MKIKGLLIMPNKDVQTVKIPGNIKFIKSLIGKDLIEVKLNKNNTLYANNDASVEEFNRLYRDNIILGTFLIVSNKNGRIISMKKRDINKYRNIFKLKRHRRKINNYKKKFLEEYYSKQVKINEQNSETNFEEPLKNVA